MVYEIFDNVSYWSYLVICRISRKPLNLDVEIILSLKDTAVEKTYDLVYSIR